MRAVTTGKTIHGNPGQNLVLPDGVVVELVPADSLPRSSTIRYWVYPAEGYDSDVWTDAMRAWSLGPGIVLSADDVQIEADE